MMEMDAVARSEAAAVVEVEGVTEAAEGRLRAAEACLMGWRGSKETYEGPWLLFGWRGGLGLTPRERGGSAASAVSRQGTARRLQK